MNERLKPFLMFRGGAALMPPANCGLSRKFAGVNDKFGVPWQINLA